MEAYKQYIDYLTAGGVAETAYMLSKQGALCGTNLPIKEMPKYNFQFEDQVGNKTPIVVDESQLLLSSITNKGVCKQKTGLRLYNQKYYLSHYDEKKKDGKSYVSIYYKKTKGGACVCITNNYILIGTWNQTTKMQNGVPQNPGQLNKRVQSLAENLIASNN